MRRCNGGAVLVLLLWMLALAGALSLGVAQEASLAMRLARAHRDHHQALQWAEIALARAAAHLLDAATPPDANAGEEPMAQAGNAADGAVAVVTDEERKVNLNALAGWTDGAALLQQLPGMTEGLAARLVARCRRAPLAHLEELLTEEGLDYAQLAAWRAWLTVTSSGAVNLHTASRDVLLLAGLRAEVADRVLRCRAAASSFRHLTPETLRRFLEVHGPPLSTEALNNVRRLLSPPSRLTLEPVYFTITSRGVARGGQARVSVEAVVRRDRGRLLVVRWHESPR